VRIVQWHPQERVDLPDMTALSFLMLGEFRRVNRALLVGEERNAIVRGYAVEPESPASAIVVVKLQDGSNPLSLALMSENYGAHITYGQLTGDKNDDEDLEGNAQQTLDFTGQPAATYTVQMRFVYTDGTTDNRAFWDDANDEETVSSEPTRHLPAIELRFSGAPSDEWIDLASVVWDGVSIDAADITDLRVFLLEGGPTFTQTTQTGSGGMPDFNRGARAANGLNTFVPFMKALARQIQDLKGPSDAGTWSWYERPYQPVDPMSALTAGHTKNLRSIDTLTYTVGDGVVSFGDFNGATGVQDCFDHIAGIAAADMPSRIEVRIHPNEGGAYSVSGPIAVAAGVAHSMVIAIKPADAPAIGGVNKYGRPVITFDGDALAPSEYAFSIANSGSLETQDIEWRWTGSTVSRGMFSVGGYVHARSCRFIHSAAPDVDALFAISSADAQHSVVEQCEVYGRVAFWDQGGVGVPPDRGEGGLIDRCRIYQGQVVLRNPAGGADTDVCAGFTIRDCNITGRDTAVYTGSIAMIDARSSRFLTIQDCSFAYGTEENCIDGRTYVSEHPTRWKIRGCRIEASVDNGSHANAAGTGGANGTGWGINFESTGSTANYLDVVDCTMSNLDSVDSGCIRLYDARFVNLRGVRFVGLEGGAGGSDWCRALWAISSNTSPGLRSHMRISDCTVADLRSATTAGFRLEEMLDVSIDSCSLWGDEDGSDITGRSADNIALYAENVDWLKVRGCTFARWDPAGTSSRTIRTIGGGSSSDQVIIEGNAFHDNGNHSISCVAAGLDLSTIISNNTIDCRGSDNQLGISVSGQGRWVVNNNAIYLNTGAGQDGIRLGSNVTGVCMGNTTNGDIVKTSVLAVRGYNEAGQDLNECNAYT
jgi:hypothetical protein